ncbi:MAG: hypothetical protein GTN67_05915 [Hydrotalea flava]|uniref:hypothetical protein n=1 Tax=Hydrotalea TaxID=1004300 RepID=UPI0009438716|nr:MULTISPECIES: hypothetical protein [Hydrotalea]NIM34971.1 hypothetical protein [Hydrotalea flava]NIM37797.1 hypothetical protein [Hydrotalea flava]NIN02966.1 hypothetical protein [Hydrotalea flava]NIN14651.1 hypothetical protein [Hydrotalea flava]NIO93723.1 hypothetical protein [Hydrotalea flava]
MSISKKCILSFILSIGAIFSYAQSNILSNNDSIKNCYVSKNNDTIILSKNKIITVGSILYIGKGSDTLYGWYNHISFKSPFNWSLWLFRDAELESYKNNYPYDASVSREHDKLLGYIHKGDSVMVKKIKVRKTKKYGIWYILTLKDYKFPKTKYQCFLLEALNSHEIFITQKL